MPWVLGGHWVVARGLQSAALTNLQSCQMPPTWRSILVSDLFFGICGVVVSRASGSVWAGSQGLDGCVVWKSSKLLQAVGQTDFKRQKWLRMFGIFQLFRTNGRACGSMTFVALTTPGWGGGQHPHLDKREASHQTRSTSLHAALQSHWNNGSLSLSTAFCWGSV